MKNPLSVAVKEIREKGVLQLRETLEPGGYQECLSDQAALVGPLAVSLDLSIQDGQVALSGRVRGRWELECGRCLSRRPHDFDARVEGSADASAPAVDASEDIRQALVLALPLKATCRPDCRGLCAACGADLNAGPCACARQPAPNFKDAN